MLKKMLVGITLCGLVLTTSPFVNAQESLRIAVEGAYPPFNMRDADGSLKGFDVEIANALCTQMNTECTVVTQDWDGMIPGLLTKKYDAILSSMSITEPRKKVIAFSKPYYRTNGIALKRKDNAEITGIDPASLKAKVIAGQTASIYSALLESDYGNSKVKLYASVDEAFSDLAVNRVAVVFADKIAAQQWLEQTGKECCEVVGPEISDTKVIGEGAGIGLRKADRELQTRFNNAIDEIVKNGTYKKINDKYFSFSVY